MALMQKAQKPFKLEREAHGCKAFSGSFPSPGPHTAMAGLRLLRSIARMHARTAFLSSAAKGRR